jgi:hypothetical protein
MDMKATIIPLLAAIPVLMVAAQTPQAGNIFEKAINQPGIGWTFYGPDHKAREVAAAELPGGHAVRVAVARKGANPWDIGALYPTIKPVAAGDTLLTVVYLRAPDVKEGETLTVPIGAGGADAPYTPIAAETVQVGSAWKRYYAAGVSTAAYAPGKARILIHLAGAKQVVEMGPAFLLDLGQGVDPAKLPKK